VSVMVTPKRLPSHVREEGIVNKLDRPDQTDQRPCRRTMDRKKSTHETDANRPKAT
jgi:hypothetical protein